MSNQAPFGDAKNVNPAELHRQSVTDRTDLDFLIKEYRRGAITVERLVQNVHKRGRIDEAITCEQAQRHDAKATYNRAIDDALGALPEERIKDYSFQNIPEENLYEHAGDDGFNAALAQARENITKLRRK